MGWIWIWAVIGGMRWGRIGRSSVVGRMGGLAAVRFWGVSWGLWRAGSWGQGVLSLVLGIAEDMDA